MCYKIKKHSKDKRKNSNGKNQKLARIQWEKEFIEYEYDEKGYLEKKNYSNGKTSTYGYNKNGKIKKGKKVLLLGQIKARFFTSFIL